MRLTILNTFIFLLIVSTNLCAQVNGKQKRPNILWITCEDMSPRLSCYGEKLIQTVHIDSLAAQGIRYTNAFTTSGVCAPSRSAIITGMYQTAMGTNNMRNYNPALKADSNLVLPSYSAVIPAGVKCFPEYLREAGYYCTNNSKQDYQFEAPVTVWDESSAQAHWRNRKKDQPFFAVFNFTITHESQLWQRENESLLVDPAKVSIPPYYPDIPEVRHAIARHLSNVKRMDDQAGKIIRQLKEDGLYDETIIFFYSDHGDGLPFFKREVYDRGLRIPLIIRFPDGYKKGMVDSQLISAVDFAPTVLSLANLPVPSYLHGKAFLGNNASPEKRAYVFAGRDRMDTEVDRVRSVHDGRFQYVKNYMPHLPVYQNIKYRTSIPMMKRMLQMRDSGLLNNTQMMWFKKQKPVEELYDLQTDPFQLNNLANDNLFQQQKKKLSSVLDQWLQQTGDAHVLSEQQLVKRMWQGKETAPKTDKPEIIDTGNGAIVKCKTTGASIGYKITSDENEEKKITWNIYNGQKIIVQKGSVLKVRAQRIGYDASESSMKF